MISLIQAVRRVHPQSKTGHMLRLPLAVAMAAIVAALSVQASVAEPVQPVADMEGSTAFKAFPSHGESLSSAKRVQTTASEGRYSLRFHAPGGQKASLVFPFDQPLHDYNVLAFDFYCERRNGARFYVNLHPQDDNDPEKNLTEYVAQIDPKIGRDGWTTIRLVRDRSMRKRVIDRQGQWTQPRALSFSLTDDGRGDFVFYVDNIRFLKEETSGRQNLIYNSSYEINTNPDIPDGWRGQIGVPPFGPTHWGLDDAEAWHGKYSLRLGHMGKSAIAWGRFINLTPGQPYTFSIYLKSERPDTKATLAVNGLERPNKHAVTVGPTWQRFELSGTAARARTSVIVTLESNGVLWLDAAQLEEGRSPGDYHLPEHDRLQIQKIKGKTTGLPMRLNQPPRAAAFKRASTAPEIDGQLDDALWRTEPALTDFADLEQDTPVDLKTRAWLAYDDQALYIAVEASEPDTDALRQRMHNAKSAWTADSVEVFLDTNGDRQSYYQFVVNPNGQAWSARYTAPRAIAAWSGHWQAQARIGKSSWAAEIRIPYTALDGSEPFTPTPGVNITRTYKPSRSKDQRQYSSWSFSHGAFHNPRAFGIAIGFDPQVLTPYQIDTLGLSWSNGQARARLQNRTPQPVTLTGRFTLDESESIRSDAFTVTIDSGKTADVASALPIPEQGHYTLRLYASDAQGRTRIQSQPLSVTVSNTTLFTFLGPQYDRYLPDETVQLRAVINGQQPSEQASDEHPTVTWTLGDQSGTLRPEAGATDWSIPLTNLPIGTHRVDVTFQHPEFEDIQAAADIRVVPESDRVVRINRWGQFLVLNDQAFFPYGFFSEAIAKQRPIEVWRAILTDLKQNNCNSVLAYTGMRTGLSDRLKPYLDVADELGIGVWVEISGYFTWHIPKVAGLRHRYTDEESALQDLRQLMDNVRGHPALLGWCAFDEPGNRPDILTGDYVTRAADLVRELDPHHPFFCTHLNHMGDTEIYGRGTDIGLMPFLARGGRYDNMFRELSGAGLPVMINSPVYGAAGNSVREPNRQEIRLHMWKAVTMGACGIQFYLYRPYSQYLWEGMGENGQQIQSIKSALLNSHPAANLLVTPSNKEIHATLRFDGINYYLIAVHTGTQTHNTTFELLDLDRVKDIEPLFGSPALSNTGNAPRLTIDFPGESVAVYRIVGTSTPSPRAGNDAQ